VLGALEVKDLKIDYAHTGNVWSGSAHLNIPAGSPYFGIDASVEFDDGDFTMGSFHVGGFYPGVPIFTDTFLDGFGGGFDIRPGRKRFFGTVDIGAIPIDPPNYTIGVTGTVSITFNDNGPVVVEVDGSGSVHGFQIATAKLLFQTNGYFEVDGNLDFNLDVAEYQASVKAFADLPAKEFSSTLNGSLTVAGYDIASAEGIVSSKGIGACGKYLALTVGFGYAWGGGVDPMFGSCDFSAYQVQPVSAASASVRAHAAAASVPIAKETTVAQIAVTGSGAAPSVVLTDPSGHAVTPQVLSPSTSRGQALSAVSASTDTTYVMLRGPRAGRWQVAAAPGSPPITRVAIARGWPPPTVKAHVTGRGHRRSLVYRVSTHPGLSVAFAEQAGRVYKLIGTARGARGTLRFTPAEGPAGRRAIVAVVTEAGQPRARVKVAAYRAPGPARPGRVRRLRVVRRGATFRVSFDSATNASLYLVKVTGSDGRRQLKVIGTGPHRLSFAARGYTDRLTVTVTGVSSEQRSGAAAHAVASYESAVYRRAHAPQRSAGKKKRSG
jgi:hypothetical protein